MIIKLGNLVMDEVSGFSGIVVARVEYLNAPARTRCFVRSESRIAPGVPREKKWIFEMNLTVVHVHHTQ